jgi:hypothetical protein
MCFFKYHIYELHRKSNCTVLLWQYCACVFEKVSVKINNLELSIMQTFCEINYSARFSCVMLGYAQVGVFYPLQNCCFLISIHIHWAGSSEQGKVLLKEKKYGGCSHRHIVGLWLISFKYI